MNAIAVIRNNDQTMVAFDPRGDFHCRCSGFKAVFHNLVERFTTTEYVNFNGRGAAIIENESIWFTRS